MERKQGLHPNNHNFLNFYTDEDLQLVSSDQDVFAL